jgi:short-subunit dehydrogenase
MPASKLALILGGTSDVGFATARHYAAKGWSVCLAARHQASAQRNADDITVRCGTDVSVVKIDILDEACVEGFVASLPRLPDTVICVVGFLGDQRTAETDSTHARTIMRTNYEAPVLLLGRFAEAFAKRGSGTIIAVSSVAGDRGRASNYIYGSAKAGLTAYLSGLRNRLVKRNVRIVTVKPGFVATRMTAGMKLPRALVARPEEVASAIFNADQKNVDVVYVRRIWHLIMLIIVCLPEWIFKRLNL